MNAGRRQFFQTRGHSIRLARRVKLPTSCFTQRSFGSTVSTHVAQDTHFGYQSVPEEEKKNLVKGVFSSVAKDYDVMNDLMSAGVHRVWKDQFVRQIHIKEILEAGNDPPRILDVAGGTGDIAFRMLDELSPYLNREQEQDNTLEQQPLVTISDINPSMLEVGEARASKRFPAATLRRIDWRVADAEALPFADNSFDVYTIAFGLRNVTDVPKALQEAHRVLARGGRFLCLEFSHVPNELVRKAYDAYSFNIIPPVGAAVAGDRPAYQYLVESIRMFPRQEELKNLMEDAGFRVVSHENLSFGVVAIHSGFKL